MRNKIVAGNWKMNLSYQEAVALINQLSDALTDEIVGETQVVVAPPAPYLLSVTDLLDDCEFISVAAQNCHQHQNGAFTGEMSPMMLHSIGVDAVILGHSERRAYFAETDTLIAEKIQAAHAQQLVAIYCCGELLEERKAGHYLQVVTHQITEALRPLSASEMANVVIAYEPVWAIGTGEVATPEQAEEVHAHIRTVLADLFSNEVAETTSILYGGSCKPDNAAELFACPNIDGGLIGGASLKAQDFVDIIKAVPQAN